MYHPGVVLDVALSSFDKRVLELVQEKVINSGDKHRLVASLPSAVQAKGLTLSNIYEGIGQALKDGQLGRQNEQLVAVFSQLKDEMDDKMASGHNDLIAEMLKLQVSLDTKQDKMNGLQGEALDRLALLQDRVKALLTQAYELNEYPIPQLFVVLPEDGPSRSSLDFMSNKFRLYYLCECGEHTKSINTKIPHHIHLAKHEGYDIVRPKEFFQQYGSYVLTALRMLKSDNSVADIPGPAPPHLIRVNAIEEASSSLDQVIEYIENFVLDKGTATGSAGKIGNNKTIKSADLRQLESFMKTKDEDRVLGNLYRTVTFEGHVKWVCIDHYCENYHEKAAKEFRETVEIFQGAFDENIGRVDVRLRSRMQAEQFYHALEGARSVYELKLDLSWDTTQSDFKTLRNVLTKTCVGVLELDLGDTDGPASDVLNRSQRYDPILSIMKYISIRSFTIRGPRELIKRSSLQSRGYNFSNLRHLDISLDQLENDIPGVKCLVAKAPNLSSLALGTNAGNFLNTLRSEGNYLLQAYNAIVEYQAYTIILKEWNIRIPPPLEPNQSITTQQCKEDLLRGFVERAGGLELNGDELEESDVDVLAKTIGSGWRLEALSLKRVDRLGDPFLNNISALVTRAVLCKLGIYTKDDEGRLRILGSIQWKHLRGLNIRMIPGTFETNVMRALVEGVKKISGRVGLEELFLHSDTDAPLTIPQGALLQDFAASTSLETLVLQVSMTLEDVLGLIRSADFSRLKMLSLWAKGFDSIQVKAILDGLQDAAELKSLSLVHVNITDEQREQMSTKGVVLKNSWQLRE